jgi:hypothetical protein
VRVAELTGFEVHDVHGQIIGTVHDLRFRMHVRPDGTQAPAAGSGPGR